MDDDAINQWVERWQKGIDRDESFHQIFRQYYRIVRSFFLKKGFSAEECEDLVQETFLRVHRKLDGFRGDSKFGTWLFPIAANVYKNHLRSRATQKRDAQEVPLDEAEPNGDKGSGSTVAIESRAGGPLDEMLVSERKRMLLEAMADLPTQMRRCVDLRVNHDLKYREIAELMQVSIDTVKAHLFQARQQLKIRLGDYFTEPNLADR